MNFIPEAISVVIPTYNRAHLIKDAVQSVLDQTLQPYEIIIIDDFSTDNTEEAINSFNSPLIKYVKNERKKGANGARNTGILIAKGEYIAFHDSDDLWLPKKLELQKKLIDSDVTVDFCFCSMKTTGRFHRNILIPSKKIETDNIFNMLETKNFISTQTIFIKSSKAIEILFDEDIKRLQDWDFVLRARKVCKIFHLDNFLVIQKLNNSSISNNTSSIMAYSDIYRKYPFLENKSLGNIYFKYKILYSKEKRYSTLLKLVFFRFLLLLNILFKK